jgi:hypothetical protein
MGVGITQPPATVSDMTIDADLNMGASVYEVLGRKLAASADVLDSVDAVVQITSGYDAYAEYATFDVPTDIVAGILRVSIAGKPDYSEKTLSTKFTINGIISPGGEQTFVYVDGSTYATKTEDIYVRPGDHLGYWLKTGASGNYFTYKEVRVLGVESARSKVAWNLT